MTVAPPDRRAIITEALRKIDDLSARLEIAEKADTEPIAVVGMGCRFPGGVNNPAQYWRLLQDGASGIVRVPPERWDADAYYSADHTVPGTICNREGGFLTSWRPDEFDAEFFGISPREAAAIDPQQRLLLEVAWEALENAGITASAIRNSQTSVFVGSTTYDYSIILAAANLPPEEIDPYIPFGSAANFAGGRLAYFLGVHGPAVVIDTACSSSLVAIHLACQSLRRRESDQALAAGVNLMLTPENTIACSRWGMLAPDGRCKTFDADANGYVRSEGCGVVVLKRLGDALRDGDSVLAVVRGSAVNQDGPSSGQTVPSGPAQQAVLRAALAAARLEPSDIDYIEAHGTGTALGDPIELGALDQVFGERNGSAPLVLGSVKTNLGHLESAAGIAGFIKTVLSVRHGYIPEHLHFTQLTPNAVEGASRFTIAAQGMEWPVVQRMRRAGVSSFGVSGTNAHVVVEQGPVVEPVAPQSEPVVSTLVVSGKTPARIASMAAVLAEWMTGEGAGVPLADVAHTLNHHRTRHKSFATVCARDRAQAVAGLQALAAGESAVGVVGAHEGLCKPGTVFVYSGQGSQWAGMGRGLLADEPVFAAAVGELEPVFVEQVGFSLRQVLAEGQPVAGDARVQPVLMGLQLALTALWRSYGVEPDAVIGHSMGEVTAAVVAGALSPAEGLRVIATRSRLMARLAGQGAVALLELDTEAAQKLIAEFPEVSLAGHLSPRQTVVAGSVAQVDAVIAAVAAQERFARRVNMEVASHTALMDPILPELASALADLTPKAATIPFISTVADSDIGAAAPLLDAAYWVANVRQPVRFTQAIAAAGRNHGTFIEISPHPTLMHAVTETLESTSSTERVIVTPAMKRSEDETLFFHTQLAGLGLTPPKADRGLLANVPSSPWLHSKYWIENRGPVQSTSTHPLLGVHIEMPSGRDHVWQADIGTEMMPWLTDHSVNGQTVVPTATFAEMALAAGCRALGQPIAAVEVKELEIEQPLAHDHQTRVTTQLAQSEDGIRIEIHARSACGNWRRYAVASIGLAHGQAPAGQLDADSETEVVLSDKVADHPSYCIHPAVLDAALKRLAATIPTESSEGPTETSYLPVSVATIRVFGHVGRRTRCRTELLSPEREDASYLGRIVLMDGTGTPTAELTGVCLRPIDARTVALPLEQKIFDTEWVEGSAPAEGGRAISTARAGSWLLLADSDPETKALVAEFTTRFSSPSRRVISEELSDETAVLDAVAKTAADPELPPVGMIVFVEKRSFDGIDFDGALRRAHDLVWAISVAAHAAVDGWKGQSPRLWVVTRNGLAVHDDEPGDPAIGALEGLIRTWRFPGELARVLAGEPDLGATLVDLDPADDVIAALMSELESPTTDDVIAWREDRRYVERLSRAAPDAGEPAAIVRADGSYIITGGLGGLGMVVARWLVDRGAGRLILNGRTVPSDDQDKALADLANNAEIVFVSGDIASPGVAERLLSAAEATGRELRGVVHAAGVIDNGLVAAVTRENLERVWSAKATGAARLHAATATRQLDWWVGFSSMASLLGLPGQLAYATANAWLDALVTWRRASGLPATAINWGQWSDVGIGRSLTLSVLDPITPDEGIEALQSLVGGALTRVGVGRLRLDRAVAATPEFRELGYFQTLVDEFDISSVDDRSTVDDGDRSVAYVPDWSQLSAESRLVELEIRLRTILARELRMSASAVNVHQPFPELGLDSMMAMTVLKETQQLVGIDLSANMLFNHPTISSLAAYFTELLAPQQVQQEDSADVTLDSTSGVLDELFDHVESASAGSESGIF
jgi:phthiocerol/phenolphthiocerol synthesis type-I polyketide synthase D